MKITHEVHEMYYYKPTNSYFSTIEFNVDGETYWFDLEVMRNSDGDIDWSSWVDITNVEVTSYGDIISYKAPHSYDVFATYPDNSDTVEISDKLFRNMCDVFMEEFYKKFGE